MNDLTEIHFFIAPPPPKELEESRRDGSDEDDEMGKGIFQNLTIDRFKVFLSLSFISCRLYLPWR
jgi:hypothetical protein